jgi:uncharacterized membrane protein
MGTRLEGDVAHRGRPVDDFRQRGEREMERQPFVEGKVETAWLVVTIALIGMFGFAYAWWGIKLAIPFFAFALLASIPFDLARKRRMKTDKSRGAEAQSVHALAALVELRNKGEITREEFEARKARL